MVCNNNKNDVQNVEKKSSSDNVVSAIWSKLKTINDPELNISIVDLGLIYNVSVAYDGAVTIIMTLTTMGCPLFSIIESQIKSALSNVKGVSSVTITLTFDPPWDPSKITEKGRVQIGFFSSVEERKL